jgi:hypothetical protein
MRQWNTTEKSLQATNRRVELFGPRDRPNPLLGRMRYTVKTMHDDDAHHVQWRKELDNFMNASAEHIECIGKYIDQGNPNNKGEAK